MLKLKHFTFVISSPDDLGFYMYSIHHSGTWFGITCWPFVWIADSCAESSVVSNTVSEIILSFILWKRKIICWKARRFAAEYLLVFTKILKLKNPFFLEQDTLCVLSFNYTDKREAALFYQYFISCWPLWWYLAVCFLCIHIAKFWKGIGAF